MTTTTTAIRPTVSDFDAWRRVFEEHAVLRKQQRIEVYEESPV